MNVYTQAYLVTCEQFYPKDKILKSWLRQGTSCSCELNYPEQSEEKHKYYISQL